MRTSSTTKVNDRFKKPKLNEDEKMQYIKDFIIKNHGGKDSSSEHAMRLFLEGRKRVKEEYDTTDSEEDKSAKEEMIQAEVKGLRDKLERFEIEKSNFDVSVASAPKTVRDEED
jgi:hypothetical protein